MLPYATAHLTFCQLTLYYTLMALPEEETQRKVVRTAITLATEAIPEAGDLPKEKLAVLFVSTLHLAQEANKVDGPLDAED